MRIIQTLIYLISFNLYLVASEIQDAHSYSINVAWINNKLDPDQLYIYPAKSDSELDSSFVTPILRWAELNPKATVNFLVRWTNDNRC